MFASSLLPACIAVGHTRTCCRSSCSLAALVPGALHSDREQDRLAAATRQCGRHENRTSFYTDNSMPLSPRRSNVATITLVALTLAAATSCGGSSEKVGGPDGSPSTKYLSVNGGGSQSAVVGTAVGTTPSVRITDSNGQGVPSITVVFSVNSGGGSITGGTAVSGPDGVASVGSWTLGTVAGENTLTASATGLSPSAITFTATALPGPPKALVLQTSPSIVAVNRMSFASQPVLHLADAYGNTVQQAGVTLAAALTSSAVVLGGTSSVQTNSAGVASFTDLSVSGKVGTYALTFSSLGLSSQSATVVISSGTAAQMSLVAGNGQSALMGSPVAIPPSVKIVDADGNPVPGAGVHFQVESGNGSITGADPISDSTGVATAGSWMLGQPGSNTISARATSLPAVALTFSASALLSFKDISVGNGFSCGVAGDGTAYCWGGSSAGQLGDGTLTARSTPTAVAGALLFTKIATGPSHSCGLANSGEPYCWGRNPYGGLGDGTTAQRQSPVPVAGGLSMRDVSAGDVHSCGITTANAPYCWGIADGVGDGSGVDQHSPSPVAGGLLLTSISAGYEYSCGLTAGGTAYCWGQNGYGQIGDSTLTSRPTPVVVSGGLSFQTITAGAAHTCGLTVDGAAYCWGLNDYGELGDGTTGRRVSPVAVQGGLTFQQIVPSLYHTCGLTVAGDVYCWGGLSLDGFVASGAPPVLAPTKIGGGNTFRKISPGPGSTHMCAIATSGQAYCWGSNGSGELGDGTKTQRSSPVPVGAP